MSRESLMEWNWQLPDWPVFRYDARAVAEVEATFQRQGGTLAGVFRHLEPSPTELLGDVLSTEAIMTSEIEGESLDRASVRSSVLTHLDAGKPRPGREDGVAQMLVDLLRSALEPLGENRLRAWHEMLMRGRSDLSPVGAYRTSPEPMRIVSGSLARPRVHYEALPSERVAPEMSSYLDWFNSTAGSLAPIARSALAHLRFECIHPFEDGNGRIGRAISEKALSQGLRQPSLTMLSAEIAARRTSYYAYLERASKTLDATEWVAWFGDVVLAAQARSLAHVEFVIAKSRLMDRLRGRINPRQEAALLRVLRDGPDGFAGDLTSGKYQKITHASPATAGRDLAELVAVGALERHGEGRGTRYRVVLV